MKVIVSHPTGNANVRAVVTGFAQRELLEQFYTSVACFENSVWLKYLIRDITRRQFNDQLKPFTATHPWREIGRHLANRTGLYRLTKKEQGIFSIDSVYQSLDKYVAKHIGRYAGNTVIYAYEDGCYHSFIIAKEKGFPCVYDLPIAYWKTTRELLMQEAERLPQWKNTLGGGIGDSVAKLERKSAELHMADIVIAPSQFVADSILKELPGKKLVISPFGTPALAAPAKESVSKISNKLRVLFVGSLGQRKGLADLGKAIELLNSKMIELVILGSRLEDEAFYKAMLPPHTYISPKPHSEVLEIMSTCDVFCLPSIAEGRALVMQEAMSRNLPIIVTKNTGGEDLVIKNETGFLVPVRSPEIIAEKINWFLEHPSLIKEMGIAAAKHAQSYTWQAYADNIINALTTISK